MFWNFVLYMVLGLVAMVIESVIVVHGVVSEYGFDGVDLMLEAIYEDKAFRGTKSVPVAILSIVWGLIIWPIRIIQMPVREYRMYDKMNELMESKNEEESENE